MRLFRGRPREPLAIAGLLAFPLFLAALMASSLALERPVVDHVRKHGKLVARYHDASDLTEAKIWLAALAVPVVIVLVGLLCRLVAHGTYVVCALGIAVAAVLPIRLAHWSALHTARYPLGIDFVPESDPANLVSPGQWEASARATASSLTHWTIGLAVAVLLVKAVLEIRRRRGAPPPPPPPPPVADTAADLVRGGATAPR